MMKLILILLQVTALYAEVLIQGPDISHKLYLERVSQQEGAITYSQWWLQERESKMEPQLLVGDFEQAERAYLTADLREAQKLYLNIAQRRHRFDWPQSSRVKIHSAMLRLAMLEADPVAKEQWLLEALALDPNLEPNAEIFPPPLREQFFMLRQSSVPFKISTQTWSDSTTLALVNGRPLRKADEVIAPNRPFRLTLLSDREFPATQIVNPPKAPGAFVAEPMISGNCAQPQWTRSREHYPTQHKAVFADSCELPVKLAAKEVGIAGTLATAPAAREEKSFWRSKWLWISVGSLVGGALVYQQIQAQNSAPSAREGF